MSKKVLYGRLQVAVLKYIIPTLHTQYHGLFFSVFNFANQLAAQNNNLAIAGTSMTNPTPNSVGEWVLTQSLQASNGAFTPRHLSFIGPILGRMGFIQRQLNGNSIARKSSHLSTAAQRQTFSSERC